MTFSPPPPRLETRSVLAPPPPSQPPSGPPGLRPWRIVGLAMLALFGLFAAAVVFFLVFGQAERDETGIISEAGDLTVLDLRVGDCFDDPGAPTGTETADVSSVDAKPCSEPHDFEVFHRFDLTSEELPSQDVLLSEIEEQCLAAFEPYVGSAYETSELDVIYMWPTLGSWKAGDRSIVCSLRTMDGSRLVDTAAGSGR
jgi:hypothetical protein